MFYATRVEYLAHYISSEGVVLDPKKIEAVEKWPEPNSVKKLRGFLAWPNYVLMPVAFLSNPY